MRHLPCRLESATLWCLLEEAWANEGGTAAQSGTDPSPIQPTPLNGRDAGSGLAELEKEPRRIPRSRSPTAPILLHR